MNSMISSMFTAAAEDASGERLAERSAEVVAATNQAMEKAREAAATEMNQLAGGLDMPGLTDALSQFNDGNPPTA